MDETLNGLHDLIVRGIPLNGVIDIPLMMPHFAEDCMSDMLVNVLYKQFSEFTLEQCAKYGIKAEPIKVPRYFWDDAKHSWNIYVGNCLVIDGEVILLIPKKYVSPSFYYSTSRFFMSKIATVLQKERTSVLNGKEVVPRKVDIQRDECKLFGSMVEATRMRAQQMPQILDDYHKDLKNQYRGRAMSDKELDEQVYGISLGEVVA